MSAYAFNTVINLLNFAKTLQTPSYIILNCNLIVPVFIIRENKTNNRLLPSCYETINKKVYLKTNEMVFEDV